METVNTFLNNAILKRILLLFVFVKFLKVVLRYFEKEWSSNIKDPFILFCCVKSLIVASEGLTEHGDIIRMSLISLLHRLCRSKTAPAAIVYKESNAINIFFIPTGVCLCRLKWKHVADLFVDLASNHQDAAGERLLLRYLLSKGCS